MQTDLDSLRELLRSDSYALDTNTLMGVSKKPFICTNINYTYFFLVLISWLYSYIPTIILKNAFISALILRFCKYFKYK